MRAFTTIGLRYPFSCALLVLLVFLGWFIGPLLIGGPVDLTAGSGQIDMSDLRPYIAAEFLVSAALLALVALLGWGRATGLTGAADPAGLRLAGWVLLVPASIVVPLWTVLLLAQPARPLTPSVSSIMLLAAVVGLFEELLFRGVVLHGLRARIGPGWAIIASSLIFGVFHMVNAVVGQDLTLTIIQVASATGLGLFLAAVTVQSQSLWPAIILHALWNGFALSAPLLFQAFPNITGPAPLQQMTPGLGALTLPTVLSVLALILYRRWLRRMRG